MLGYQTNMDEHDESSGQVNHSNGNVHAMGVVADGVNKKAMSEKVEGRAAVP